MPENYTLNQTGAIACLFASALWSITAHGVARMLNQTSLIYTILVAINWILVPFYIKLMKHAFIAGIFLWILAMCYLPITPSLMGTIPWYTLSIPLLYSTWFIWYFVAIAGIYFSYKSYKEVLIW